EMCIRDRFWVWHQTGPYFGMPIVNFAGWALTGLLFVSAARIAWRSDPPSDRPLLFPFMVYGANMAFASALCTAVGLWEPVVLAVLGGLLPAAAALAASTVNRRGGIARSDTRREAEPSVERWSWRFLRCTARVSLRGRTIEVVGHNLPRVGPFILAPQHVHHLDDGRALLALSERPLHFVVALDWVPTRLWRVVMETLCALAGWPVIVRPRELERPGVLYSPRDGQRALVAGLRQSIERLVAGQALVVFPEGYPLVDPHLPHRRANVNGPAPGALWIAKKAAERLGRPVPVFPVRLQHERDRIRVSVEPPLLVQPESDIAAQLRSLAVSLGSAEEPVSSPQSIDVRRG
ncbi:MAG: carotenoid biosynthesis protein, partial [Thermomicrobium sp.]|nr:carotenoid biosynthesis protein [Thermomicrobium sp.]